MLLLFGFVLGFLHFVDILFIDKSFQNIVMLLGTEVIFLFKLKYFEKQGLEDMFNDTPTLNVWTNHKH